MIAEHFRQFECTRTRHYCPGQERHPQAIHSENGAYPPLIAKNFQLLPDAPGFPESSWLTSENLGRPPTPSVVSEPITDDLLGLTVVVEMVADMALPEIPSIPSFRLAGSPFASA